MRLVFLGTPQFAVPALEALIETGHAVTAVYTQPDRPKGRGQELAASPVKMCAAALGIPVRQPERIRQPEIVAELRTESADAMVVVGYGQIIPQSIIDLPPHGIINVHASLLPRYRGAAPIQWAIANGDRVTGVTTMRINAGLDTGGMLLKAETAIGPEENALQLGERLAAIGAVLLIKTLAELPPPVPQDNDDATLAPILKKEDGLIDWEVGAPIIANRCRGFLPWPGTYSTFRNQNFRIWRCRAVNPEATARPGTFYSLGRRLLVACGADTALELFEVQVEGRKRVSAEAFLNGQRLDDNERLGVS